MSGFNKSQEFDSLYARRLFLLNADKTDPPANYALLANGNGGTYFGNLFGSVPPTGFNAVYLPDSNVSTVADGPYNVLSIKQGIGVSIVLDVENNLIFNTVPIVPSSFSYINTAEGVIYADAMQASFTMEAAYGTNFKVVNNRLIIGGIPSFGNIEIQNPTENSQLIASNILSSFSLAAGPGIDISLSTNTTNVIKIETLQKSFCLNKITIDNQSSLSFLSTYNNIDIKATGNLSITAQNESTLNFETHSFSRIETDTNQIINASTSSEILVLNRGYGIDYVTGISSLTIQLASTMGRTIQTPTASTIADINSNLNLSAGEGITYSNGSDGSLQINSTDFNKIICSGGSPILSNTLIPEYQKQVTFKGENGLTVTGDSTTNTVSFTYTGLNDPSTINTFPNSQILIYSSLTSLSSPIRNPYKLSKSASLGIAGISPVLITPNTSPTESSLFYISIDPVGLLSFTSTILLDLTSSVQSLKETASTGATYAEFKTLTLTSIGGTGSGSPLMSFNYSTNCVGINKSVAQLTNLVSLDISGTVLANTYATYSDPILKDFGEPFTLTLDQLETLQPSNFTWLSNNKKDVGFSAADVEGILPTAVSMGDNGLKLVDYSKISILSIAALKDTHSRIKSLESTVQSLLEKQIKA